MSELDTAHQRSAREKAGVIRSYLTRFDFPNSNVLGGFLLPTASTDVIQSRPFTQPTNAKDSWRNYSEGAGEFCDVLIDGRGNYFCFACWR